MSQCKRTQKPRPRILSDREIAFVMELHAQAKIEDRIHNFWWACGKAMGVDGQTLRRRINDAKQTGMRGLAQ